MKRFNVRVAAAFAFVAGVTVLACSGGTDEPADSTNSAASSTHVNLCVGQVANSFHCLDDTRFQLCTGNGTFVVESCAAAGLCATRHPATKNPCIGADRAKEIDGVPPTPAGQIDDGNGGASGGAQNGGNPGNAGNAGGGNTAGGNTGGGNTNTGAGNTGGGNAGAGNSGGGNTGGQCVGGPKFDPAGTKNVGNGHGGQFIGGQCLSAADCASGCCALPCGICSGPGAQFQAGKQGCGFGG
jgi:hypothetical protein